jgi:hypothetical protein
VNPIIKMDNNTRTLRLQINDSAQIKELGGKGMPIRKNNEKVRSFVLFVTRKIRVGYVSKVI